MILGTSELLVFAAETHSLEHGDVYLQLLLCVAMLPVLLLAVLTTDLVKDVSAQRVDRSISPVSIADESLNGRSWKEPKQVQETVGFEQLCVSMQEVVARCAPAAAAGNRPRSRSASPPPPSRPTRCHSRRKPLPLPERTVCHAEEPHAFESFWISSRWVELSRTPQTCADGSIAFSMGSEQGRLGAQEPTEQAPFPLDAERAGDAVDAGDAVSAGDAVGAGPEPICHSTVYAEEVGEHVVAIRWPFLAKAKKTEDEGMQRDYARVVEFLRNRHTPYGLVHDLRSMRSITTLAPIAQRLLGDAYALSRGGLCRRVAVLHSVKGIVANAVLPPLLKLSPVHPAKAFTGELADDALRWVGAHATSGEWARCVAE